jgi:hypothetical protein
VLFCKQGGPPALIRTELAVEKSTSTAAVPVLCTRRSGLCGS